jgi:hypothetical protein
MKQRIIEIIKELKDVIKQQEISISDDTLFSEAVSCFRGEQAQKNRKCLHSPISAPNSPIPETPTPKQISFLSKYHVKIPGTKAEATKIIKDFIENTKKENI